MSGRSARGQPAGPPALLRKLGPPGLAIFVSGGVAAIWVALTAATGLTFHLFPAVIAGAPAFVWRLLSPREVRPWRLALLIGWPAVILAWALLEALDIMPTATFFNIQPGGVRAEIIVIALLGAFLATRLTHDRRG